MHHKETRALAPDAEHCAVYDVGEASLRVISNRFPKGAWITTSAEEPTPSPHKRDKVSHSSKLTIHSRVPSKVRRKRGEVLGLESNNDGLGEGGLHGEGLGLASVVGAVAEFLAHETVTVMSVEWSFGDIAIVIEVSSPPEVGPTHSSNRRMHVSRFDCI